MRTLRGAKTIYLHAGHACAAARAARAWFSAETLGLADASAGENFKVTPFPF